MRDTLMTGLACLGGLIGGYVICLLRRMNDREFWQKRADYWYGLAYERQHDLNRIRQPIATAPDFSEHPHFHATRRYASLDDFLMNVALSAGARGEMDG